MKIAYCDCFSGVSGDMFLAAMVDAGLPLELLREQLGLLAIDERVEVSVEDVHKGALRGTQITVDVEDSHHHRHLEDIQAMIEDSRLDEGIKRSALSIFMTLAEAEGQVHGIPMQQVHFHEVGALDSIVDVVGAAIGLHTLGIERLYASALPYGTGQVKTDHGPLPLPAPATLQILARAHAPLVPSPAQAELVTPTGAAILATLATFQRPDITLERIGIGAGRKELPWPNVMRLWLGSSPSGSEQPLVLLETNIDDMNPQFFGGVMSKLFEAGARDVFFTPIYMKKNRPATMVSILARRSEEAALARILLEQTTTLGLRIQPVYRFEAEREFKIVETPYGPISVKIKILDGRRMQAQPEYEDCAAAAANCGAGVGEVYAAALTAGRELLASEG
jgi:pyridinium-3,5-bisthiocarboxylic acid mononucleotide nickel chelatase